MFILHPITCAVWTTGYKYHSVRGCFYNVENNDVKLPPLFISVSRAEEHLHKHLSWCSLSAPVVPIGFLQTERCVCVGVCLSHTTTVCIVVIKPPIVAFPSNLSVCLVAYPFLGWFVPTAPPSWPRPGSSPAPPVLLHSLAHPPGKISTLVKLSV